MTTGTGQQDSEGPGTPDETITAELYGAVAEMTARMERQISRFPNQSADPEALRLLSRWREIMGRARTPRPATPATPEPERHAPEETVFLLELTGEERALIDNALQTHHNALHTARFKPSIYGNARVQEFSKQLEATDALMLTLKALKPISSTSKQPASQESMEMGSTGTGQAHSEWANRAEELLKKNLAAYMALPAPRPKSAGNTEGQETPDDAHFRDAIFARARYHAYSPLVGELCEDCEVCGMAKEHSIHVSRRPTRPANDAAPEEARPAPEVHQKIVTWRCSTCDTVNETPIESPCSKCGNYSGEILDGIQTPQVPRPANAATPEPSSHAPEDPPAFGHFDPDSPREVPIVPPRPGPEPTPENVARMLAFTDILVREHDSVEHGNYLAKTGVMAALHQAHALHRIANSLELRARAGESSEGRATPDETPRYRSRRRRNPGFGRWYEDYMEELLAELKRMNRPANDSDPASELLTPGENNV